MMRADVLNSHVYPVRTEMTATKRILTLRVCSTDESKFVDENLSQIYFTEEDKSTCIIVNKCSKEEDESECVQKNINKQKNIKNEAEYEVYSVTYEVLGYFNIFECGMNLLNRLDVTYERACMATPKKNTI